MDVTLFIAILTLIVAAIGIYISIRQQKKTRIFYFSRQPIKLYDELIKNIPGMQIMYQGEPIRKSMFILKGAFVCLGDKDITLDQIKKPINFTFKEATDIWYYAKIIKETKNLEISSQIKDQELSIKFVVLQHKDGFVLEALAQSENFNVLPDYKIVNVENIKHNKLGIEKELKRLIIAWIFCIFLIVAAFWVPFNSPRYLIPHYFNTRGETVSQFSTVDTLDPLLNNHFKILDTTDFLQFKKKYPTTINLFDQEESIRKAADTQYSQWKLLREDTTRRYRVSPHYFVSFTQSGGGLTWSLSLPIVLIFISIFITTRYILHYLLFKSAGKIASALFESS